MGEKIIELKGVSAGYVKNRKNRKPQDEQLIIKDISLEIKEGHSVCLLGPNGCGKTTLLRVIAGMLPSYGEILLDGKNIHDLKRKEIASYISFFSQMSQVYFSYSVYETVMQGRYVHGSTFFSGAGAVDKEIVDETLEKLRLTDIADKQITTLSGGQLQRVMLARCIAQGSPVMILDEPMNHIDMKIQAELFDYLLEWRQKPVKMVGKREYKPTIIGVFHDINVARYLADEIAFISKGRILASGKKEEILTKELLERTYDFNVVEYLQRFNMQQLL
ncbi:ABC transporter ATP-binding protein [Butyrivibrio sp. AE3004]|uniref:ABC transporter ATP-binding protein n=1 Tax=Butyrivibrio sp. AE3004 TaxID=1506994 RepID=UPI0004943455|nr:ABC transporter ATP-binding protein [Butyrivibrio sp. AE3004]